MARDDAPISPMTLGNMRQNGVRGIERADKRPGRCAAMTGPVSNCRPSRGALECFCHGILSNAYVLAGVEPGCLNSLNRPFESLITLSPFQSADIVSPSRIIFMKDGFGEAESMLGIIVWSYPNARSTSAVLSRLILTVPSCWFISWAILVIF